MLSLCGLGQRGAVIPIPVWGLYPELTFPDCNPSQGLNTYYVQDILQKSPPLIPVPSLTPLFTLNGTVSLPPRQSGEAARVDLHGRHLLNSSGSCRVYGLSGHPRLRLGASHPRVSIALSPSSHLQAAIRLADWLLSL